MHKNPCNQDRAVGESRRNAPLKRRTEHQMSNIIEQLNQEQHDKLLAKGAHPEFTHGDTVKVWVKIREGDKERLQAYEGVVIARSGTGIMESFTVRKISYGEGVERVFPVLSPNI